MAREITPGDLVYGILSPEDMTASIIEGESTTFALFIGGTASKPTIAIDQVGLHELGGHLETFSGVDVGDPDSDDAIAPGKRVTGIRNLKFGIVFLSNIDGQAMEQYPGFFNVDDDRER